MQTVSRVYDTYSQAQAAVTAIEAAGVPAAEVSLVANKYVSEKYADVDDVSKAGAGAGIGGALGEHLRPRFGVYAVRALVGGTWRNGVANLGKRPTVGKLQENFEVHLFDFTGDLYGQVLRVAVIDFIRPELKFAGLDALKAQIAADGQTAREILATMA